MQKKLNTWQFILDNLQASTPVVLLYVLQSSGSSPGRQGFMMAVNATGALHGSVGGGIMEYKLVELAKMKLRLQQHMQVLHLQVHNKSATANQSGMICSGEQTIWMYTVKHSDKASIAALIASATAFENGTLQLTASGICFYKTVPSANYHFIKNGANDFTYHEKTGFQQQVTIIGGGHCALALCKIMRSLDFYITVLDDRSNLNTLQQNEYAHVKHIVKNYSQLGPIIASGSNHYIVIMTVGYRTDAMVVQSLCHHTFAYLGLLGSKNKIAQLFADLTQQGVSSAYLNSIKAPIGVHIKSQTTQEIAVSIAAEIIAVKNNQLR
jgi:xanthine dehydrogenase accessory factor